jgi:hypothetical protein
MVEVCLMIYVEMRGRTGNQLFRYAFARALMLKTGDPKLILSFNHVKAQAKAKPGQGFVNDLENFKVIPYEEYQKPGKLLRTETNFFQKILVVLYKLGLMNKTRTQRMKYENTFQTILNFWGIYWAFDKADIKIHKRRKQLVIGNFEWQGYFDSIRETLLEELQPKEPVLAKNVSLLEEIETTNSICVSVRRGDFLAPEFAKSFAVCTPEYYLEAVRIMREKVDNPHFFVFSDDIAWCEQTLFPPSKDAEGAERATKVTYVSQQMPVYETLRLMYSCKHFIVSNSTFSWWGQYLSRNPSKIVISPTRWNNDGFDSPLIGKEWILIEP